MPLVISNKHSRMTGWRPKRSARGAKKSDPAAMPIKPALNSRPRSAPLSPHSEEMGAAVKAMTSTSKAVEHDQHHADRDGGPLEASHRTVVECLADVRAHLHLHASACERSGLSRAASDRAPTA